ncbi:MAG: hypothetical protein ACLTFB_02385 [Candidatus Phytoplasma pyri]
MNSINSKKKLLKFLLIFPLIITFIFAIYCCALTHYERQEISKFKIMLSKLTQQNEKDEKILEYLNVQKTISSCNEEDIFSPMKEEIKEKPIKITNKTYILKQTPILENSITLKQEYEIFLDDRVYSDEDIRVAISKPTLIKMEYPEISTKKIKKINNIDEIEQKLKNLDFIKCEITGLKNENGQSDDVILKASSKKAIKTERNPRLILEIEYCLDYQQFKEIDQIKKLIEQNVGSMDFEFEFKVSTIETT